jgi:hypothetical protein
MKSLNTIEKELNAIRASLYEKTKDMSSSEMTAYIKARTATIHRQFDIKPIDRVTADKPKGTTV